MVPIRKLYAASVSHRCFKGVIGCEGGDIRSDGSRRHVKLIRERTHRFMSSPNQNAHDFSAALVGSHSRSPPFSWARGYLIGQIGSLISYLRNFFGENKKPDEWRQWLSLSQHSSGYLVTRRIPRHGAFARYERVFGWRALRLFTLPQSCSHRFVGGWPRHRPHLEAKRRLPGTSHGHHLVTTGAF